MEKIADDEIKIFLKQNCTDCPPLQRYVYYPTLSLHTNGGDIHSPTYGIDSFYQFLQYGNLHLDYWADCNLRKCCATCKASCTVTYQVWDSYHFDLNPGNDHFHVPGVGIVGNTIAQPFTWRVEYQKQWQYETPCKSTKKDGESK